MTRPLDGLLVVSLEQAVAAPFLSMRLADAGARVIKLERPEGDFGRDYDNFINGLSTYFVWLNRSKESIAVDLKNPAELALVHRILARADVWIQNLAPGATDRLGLGSAALRQRYPRLVTCDISGYGDVGPPYDTMKAYDMLVQAESGIASVTGSPEEPGRIGVSACDMATGMFAHAAIVEALLAREHTGRGEGIEVSMFGAMAEWMAAPLLWHEYANRAWTRTGLHHPAIVPYGAYETGDGKQTMIATQNQREWERFCNHVLERPELIDHPALKNAVSRVDNREVVEAAMDAVFRTLTRDELVARLQKADVPYSSVNTVADLSTHGAVRRITVETSAGPVEMTAPVARFTGEERHYGRVPDLDEHGAAIRKEFSA
jgi:crotonobetainyl-CoA:carnitine CoA-transferase CaiB-like acyl-CoA transferase